MCTKRKKVRVGSIVVKVLNGKINFCKQVIYNRYFLQCAAEAVFRMDLLYDYLVPPHVKSRISIPPFHPFVANYRSNTRVTLEYTNCLVMLRPDLEFRFKIDSCGILCCVEYYHTSIVVE